VAGPFYNAIKGTTSGAAATGAFTPNAASTGFRAWSNVPTGWVGMVRFEDGSAWELSYCYWNGTTLSRGTNQLYASSTGSVLSLTPAATAAMIPDASNIMPDVCAFPMRGLIAIMNATTMTAIGAAATGNGTASAVNATSTNFLTRQHRIVYTSATTASAVAGWNNTNTWAVTSNTAGQGGSTFTCRFGASGLPTGPRLYIGLNSSSWANTTEPSAQTGNLVALGLDSTDTNLQILTNSNAGGCTKIDTGIPLAVNGWYEINFWQEPGSLTVYFLLIRCDTGAIYYGSTSTDVPAANSALSMVALGGLNATNTGTAFVMNLGHVLIRPVI
jgi:hypothetical protein